MFPKLAVIALPLLFLLTDSAATFGKPYIYGSNGSDTVTVIDAGERKIVASIPLPKPGGGRVLMSPDGAFAYVTTGVSIITIETATNRIVNNIRVCCNLYGFNLTPGGEFLYVSGSLFNSVSIIDTKSNRIAASVAAGVGPYDVAFSPDGKLAYVTNSWSDTVSIIDTASKAVVSTISVGYQPRGISLTPNGLLAYVANAVSDNVWVIDTTTRKVVSIIPVGSLPVSITFNRDGSAAYVPNGNSNNLSVIDVGAARVVATIPLDAVPITVAVSSNSDEVYVATGKTLSIIDARSNTVIGRIPIPNGIAGIALSPDSSLSAARKISDAPRSPYAVTNLGVLQSVAVTINDSGQIGGYSIASGRQRGFIWIDGRVTDLGSLARGTGSIPTSINRAGQISGHSGDRAFLYQDGIIKELSEVQGIYGAANGMNDRGQIVGGSQIVPRGPSHAFLYESGTMTDLGTLGGLDSTAYAINNDGVVVGSADTAEKSSHAFLYKSGRLQDLGTLGGQRSVAAAISNTGLIAGNSQIDNNKVTHAFLYAKGVMKDLGTMGGGDHSEAFGVNDSGQTVGFAYTVRGRRAFIYSNGTMQDLTDLLPPGTGWVLTDANAINNVGQIVGTGFIHAEMFSFLLTPTANKAPAISAVPSLPSLASTSYFLEAESGVLSAPMMKFCDSQAAGGEYIAAAADNPAAATYFVNVIKAGSYVVWLRIMSKRGPGSISFTLDHNRAQDFDASEAKESVSWQWIKIGSLDKPAPALGTLELADGPHEIVLRLKDPLKADIKLDRLILTDDLAFDPRK